MCVRFTEDGDDIALKKAMQNMFVLSVHTALNYSLTFVTYKTRVSLFLYYTPWQSLKYFDKNEQSSPPQLAVRTKLGQNKRSRDLEPIYDASHSHLLGSAKHRAWEEFHTL